MGALPMLSFSCGASAPSGLGSVQAATAAMAHELRQPLTAIATRGAAGLNWLKRTPPELNKVSECLASMVDAGRRAEEVIAGIRGLFRDTPTRRTIDSN